MRVRRRCLLWMAAVAAVTLMGTSGYAQNNSGADTLYQDPGNRLGRSNKVWAQSDNCGKESFRKFPDYTTEGAAKRDAYMRECLRKHRLPPRADVAQPLPPKQKAGRAAETASIAEDALDHVAVPTLPIVPRVSPVRSPKIPYEPPAIA